MSTVVTTESINVTSNFTSGNISLPYVSFQPSSGNSYSGGPLQAVSVIFGAMNSFLAIVINILVLLCILLDKELRKLTYFWNIISLCFANLLAGVTVIPLSTNIYHVGKWLHGDIICKAFIMTDYTQLPLAATILICTLLHCFGEMITSPTSRVWYAIAKSNRLRYILIAVPWGIALVCIGALLAGEKTKKPDYPNDVCYFILKDEFSVPSLITMFIGPLFLMFIVATVALAAYILRIRKLELTHALRASMLPPIIMSLTYWICWMPFAVLILRFYTCKKCKSPPALYTISVILTCAAPFLSAILSFIHPDIRRRIRELWTLAMKFLCSFVGEDGIIAVKWTSGDPHLIKADDSVPADF